MTIMARSRLLAAALAACLVLPVAAAAAPACEVPPEILAEARPLPNAARALAAGGLSILAIGSASAVGNGSEAEAAWPARMQAALQERYPGRRIEVSVRGGRGVTATEHHRRRWEPGPGGARGTPAPVAASPSRLRRRLPVSRLSLWTCTLLTSGTAG